MKSGFPLLLLFSPFSPSSSSPLGSFPLSPFFSPPPPSSQPRPGPGPTPPPPLRAAACGALPVAPVLFRAAWAPGQTPCPPPPRPPLSPKPPVPPFRINLLSKLGFPESSSIPPISRSVPWESLSPSPMAGHPSPVEPPGSLSFLNKPLFGSRFWSPPSSPGSYHLPPSSLSRPLGLPLRLPAPGGCLLTPSRLLSPPPFPGDLRAASRPSPFSFSAPSASPPLPVAVVAVFSRLHPSSLGPCFGESRPRRCRWVAPPLLRPCCCWECARPVAVPSIVGVPPPAPVFGAARPASPSS